MRGRESDSTPKDQQAMMSKGKSRKPVRCFRCKKLGHYKQDCKVDLSEVGDSSKPKGHKAKVTVDDSEDDGALVANGSLVAGGMSANWIVDSGATSHMCYHGTHS